MPKFKFDPDRNKESNYCDDKCLKNNQDAVERFLTILWRREISLKLTLK